ncbi:MAG TPA: hypothetical protein VM821_03435 [Abditibacteriaceae bacterium]|nr:hypothetical protein [Abditibacteriaceae bacterium]
MTSSLTKPQHYAPQIPTSARPASSTGCRTSFEFSRLLLHYDR